MPATFPSRFSSLSQFRLNSVFQRRLLLWAKISRLILVINCHKPDLLICREIVVDNPQAAPASLFTSRVTPTQLSKAARARYHRTEFRVGFQDVLQVSITVIIEVVRKVPSKCRSFDENHGLDSVRYQRRVVDLAIGFARHNEHHAGPKAIQRPMLRTEFGAVHLEP